MTAKPTSAFEAAELAYDEALASPEVASAQKLEAILGGNGEWTAERAYGVWLEKMDALGFPQDYPDEDEAA